MNRSTDTFRNQTEACKSQTQIALEQTDAGRLRKEPAATRREEQLSKELEKEDTLIQEESRRSVSVSGLDVDICEWELRATRVTLQVGAVLIRIVLESWARASSCFVLLRSQIRGGQVRGLHARYDAES